MLPNCQFESLQISRPPTCTNPSISAEDVFIDDRLCWRIFWLTYCHLIWNFPAWGPYVSGLSGAFKIFLCCSIMIASYKKLLKLAVLGVGHTKMKDKFWGQGLGHGVKVRERDRDGKRRPGERARSLRVQEKVDTSHTCLKYVFLQLVCTNIYSCSWSVLPVEP